MSVNTLTQKIAEMSRRLTGLEPGSDEYEILENEILDLEDELETLVNPHDKMDFE